MISAASLATGPMVAFAAGLSLLACTESGDDAGESNAVTTDPSTSESTSTSGDGDGDGDGDTQETLDYGGSDYGGAPPCDELSIAIPISVGNNVVDTTLAGNQFTDACGGEVGAGPDRMLEFISPADGQFTFAIAAEFNAWLLLSGYYCEAYSEDECVPNQALDIELVDGQTLYLILDGPIAPGGPVSIDVTQG